jgi:hypothetical protein
MRFSFANREHEVRRLLGFLRSNISTDSNRICVVSGVSGIGKSRLVNEAFDIAQPQTRHVRIPIKQSDFRCGESGYFLRASAVAVGGACKKQDWGISLDRYAHQRGGLGTIRAAFEAVAKKVEKVTTGDSNVSADLMSAWSKTANTLYDLLGEPSTPALRLASDYLEKALSAARCALVLENAQLIDAQSLHYIHALLDKCSSLQLIYEYTTNAPFVGSPKPYQGYDGFLAACLERDLSALEIILGVLDFNELALKNFQSDDSKFIEVLRRELNKHNGNIRDVERLHEVASKHAHVSDEAGWVTIEATFAEFATSQKLILWIIALSRRSLDPYELSLITQFISAGLRPLNPVDVAKSLTPFILFNKGTFSIDHDSLLPRLYSTASIQRECLVAASALDRYFRSFLEQSNFSQYSEYEILFALLWLSRPLNSADLVDFAVSRLSQRTRASGRPGSLLKLVHEFAQQAPFHTIHQATIVRLIRIIYDACWIEGALDLTAAHRNDVPEIRLCHCQALCITGQHNEAETELKLLAASLDAPNILSSKRNRIKIYAGLVGALTARIKGDYDLARRRYLDLDLKTFIWPEDKCLYYRFGEIAGVPDAARRLQTAIEIGRKLKEPLEFVRAAVSMAMTKAERGFLDEAAALLDEADAVSGMSYVDSYMSANNRLVVSLLSGAPSKSCYHAVGNLLPLVIESMDRVLITNNLMAAAILLGDTASASKFAQHLEDYLSIIVEKNMRRLSYFNCSLFHTAQGSGEIARDYFQRAFEDHVPYDETYWQARKAGIKDVAVDFRLSCDFDLPMMSNWYFSWPDFEAKPE